jgi:hypothetical protein
LDALLGLILLAAYVIAIVALAAAVTFVAIKIFPTRDYSKKDEDDKPPKPPSDGDAPAGRLFRRAKRGTA